VLIIKNQSRKLVLTMERKENGDGKFGGYVRRRDIVGLGGRVLFAQECTSYGLELERREYRKSKRCVTLPKAIAYG
jgi:hypothetical protein